MPKMPDFAGPFNHWTRAELESVAARQRRDPPKIRVVLDWMEANDCDAIGDLDDEMATEVFRKLDLGPIYASATDILRGRRPNIVEGSAPMSKTLRRPTIPSLTKLRNADRKADVRVTDRDQVHTLTAVRQHSYRRGNTCSYPSEGQSTVRLVLDPA